MISSKRDFPVCLTSLCLLFMLLGPQLSLASAIGSYSEDTGSIFSSYSYKSYMADDFHLKLGLCCRHVRYSKYDDPSRIEEGLYSGSVVAAAAAARKRVLKRVNVTHVLSFTIGDFPLSFHPHDFIYKTIYVFGNPGVKLSHYFYECFKFIEDATAHGDSVLVHYYGERARSASAIVTIAYMMFKYGMSYTDASTHVLERRPVKALDFDLVLELKEFERWLQGGGWRDGLYNASFGLKPFPMRNRWTPLKLNSD